MSSSSKLQLEVRLRPFEVLYTYTCDKHPRKMDAILNLKGLGRDRWYGREPRRTFGIILIPCAYTEGDG
ncbi:hypothetical protein SERLA73DRAFT_177022 [Serpula lacrymans var. lacrymans S7.3]|uniref:Uncharacterized protein n=2 Tax=Serpula lacrymans var. lacrymans TaxID=341189 RepID=F8PQQ4_SERL3|nr:uncharacterized protein SERLADRAFT_460399 [Serpula lacrymans var. lacrymans S7.9]EGO01614.1 hypothetical protein SERLA73DRAFT_177022 [Serpula lacrymans var. lacrymans S7.3]EGO27268.1 hypothetical protein SERLADRAFT_460399 [Serpula lacrymans var. lacrymans S7.9]